MIKCRLCNGTNLQEWVQVDINRSVEVDGKVYHHVSYFPDQVEAYCNDCKKDVPVYESDNYCEECGQLFAVHNDDGSCVQDSGDALSESWLQKADESYEYERDNS